MEPCKGCNVLTTNNKVCNRIMISHRFELVNKKVKKLTNALMMLSNLNIYFETMM